MTYLAWPLQRNVIRRGVRNNAFGMVRNGGTKAHQGWDLMARPLTPCHAIADGKVTKLSNMGAYGMLIELEFKHHLYAMPLYAIYAHLSFWHVRRDETVWRGQVIGLTGNTGNAASMHGEDQHLHFEIRTKKDLAVAGLDYRIDPARLYGRPPLIHTFFEGHGEKVSTAGATGLKVQGVNVREDVK